MSGRTHHLATRRRHRHRHRIVITVSARSSQRTDGVHENVFAVPRAAIRKLNDFPNRRPTRQYTRTFSSPSISSLGFPVFFFYVKNEYRFRIFGRVHDVFAVHFAGHAGRTKRTGPRSPFPTSSARARSFRSGQLGPPRGFIKLIRDPVHNDISYVYTRAPTRYNAQQLVERENKRVTVRLGRRRQKRGRRFHAADPAKCSAP